MVVLTLSFFLFQSPSHSLKLKELKELIEDRSPATFGNFSSNRDGLLYLKRKVSIVFSYEQINVV